MREIKFRAWDKYEEKMSYDVSIYSDKNGSWWSGDHIDDDSGDTIISFDKGELMQFTGLKDKNGKAIYEGDILRGETDWNFGRASFVGKVHFKHDGFFVDGYVENYKRPQGERDFRMDEMCNFEVVGNIHENPELLK